MSSIGWEQRFCMKADGKVLLMAVSDCIEIQRHMGGSRDSL